MLVDRGVPHLCDTRDVRVGRDGRVRAVGAYADQEFSGVSRQSSVIRTTENAYPPHPPSVDEVTERKSLLKWVHVND